MANKRVGVTLDINADISQVRTVATQLQQLLSSSNLSSGVQKNINKLATGLSSALTDLEAKASQPIKDSAGAKDLERAYKRVFDYFNKINLEVSNLSNLKGTDLEAIFPDVQKKIKDLDEYFKTFERVQKKIESSADLKNNKRALERAEQSKTDSEKKIETIKANGYSEQSVIDEAAKSVKELKGRWEELKTAHEKAAEALKEYNDKLAESTKKSESAKEKRTYADELKKKYSIKEINGQLRADWRTKENRGKDEQGNSIAEQHTREWQAAEQAARAYETAAKEAAETVPKLETDQAGVDKLAQDAEAVRQAYVQAAEAKDKLISKKKYDSSIESETTNIEKQEERIKDLTEKIKGYDDQLKTAFDNLKTDFQKLTGDESFKDLEYSEENLKKLSDAAAAFKTGEIEKAVKIFEDLGITLDKAVPSTEKIRNGIDKVGNSLHQMGETEQEINHLTSRLKYFFSLAGGFQLMRRAIRSAVETTKELDAAMTQTAVVSTKTVGEMWKTLPQYNVEAKKLGSSIVDVYKAQTLYVQQGLDMNSAMDLGIETLKMARVAGIDAAEATNSMTAALHGFNMELNETSATRINDVYSKLAQNTASNVQEISTAMTKTAALANSANMSFENTAAFLATIIESTREGAETAGTALKTVIARFTEVKKLYSEGELTGTDEEGQEVDVNKISAALRTAGINMNDFFTGAKGLDEIFIELGSKWDSLTTVQQRYIATMAAGSRQQSRFLALMQNYSRTVELTQMAYNSAGSGQEQFEKTLDSLEVKLHKLKAAWDTFTMGIANSDFIKGVIDAGTKILDLLNNIIDKLSGGKGITKSILSLVTAAGVFKGGKSLFNIILGKAAPSLIKNSGLKQLGMQGGITLAAQMTTSFKSAFERGGNKKLFSETNASPFTQWLRGAYGSYDTKDIEKINQIKDKLFSGQNVSAIQQQAIMLDIKTGNIDQANAKLKELGITEKATTEQTEMLNSVTSKTGANLSNLATTAGILGGVLIGVGSALENSGGTASKFGTIIKGIGIGLVSFMGIIKVLDVAIKTFSVSATASISSIPILGWIAAAISLFISLISIISSFTESASERFERISNAAEGVVNGVEEVKNKFEEVKDLIEEIGNKEDALDELVVGTEDWNTAVKDLNQSIYELLRIYPELAGAVKWVNDHLELNMQSDTYKAWLKSQQETLQNGVIAAGSGKVKVWKEESQLKNKENRFYGYVNNFTSKELASLYDTFFVHDDIPIYDYLRLSKRRIKLSGNEEFKNKALTPEFIDNLYNEFWQTIFPDIQNGNIKNQNDLATVFEAYYNSLDDSKKQILSGESIDLQGLQWAFGVLPLDENLYTDQQKEQAKARNDSIQKLLEIYYHNGELNQKLTSTYLNEIDSAFKQSKYSNNEYGKAYRQNLINNFADIYNNIIEEDIKKYTSNEINKEAYKKALGLKEDKDIDKDLFEEYARAQLTKDYIFSVNDEYSKNLEKYFQSLEPQVAEVAAKLIADDINSLSLEEYKALAQETINLGTDFSNFSNIDVTSFKKTYEEYFHGLGSDSSIGKWLENFVDNIGQLDNLSKSLIKIKSQDSFSKIIEDLGVLSEEAKNLIATTDYTKAENIRDLTKSLEALGIAVGSDFTNKLIAATGAVYTYSAATVKTSVEALEGAKSSYEKMLEGQRKFTEKEYAEFAQLEGFNARDWIKSGSNEYTYLGKIESILFSIESMVTKLTKEEPEQLKQRIKEANQLSSDIEELNKKTELITTPGPDVGHYVTADFEFQDKETGEIKQVKASDFATAILSPEGIEFDDTQLKKFAEQLDIDVGNAIGDDLLLILQTALSDYKNREGLKQQLAILQNEKTAIALQSTSGQGILNNEIDEEVANGHTVSELLQAKLEIGDVENIEYLKKQMGLTAEKAKEYDDVLKALTIDSKVSKINFDNLTKTYKDNADALTEEGKKTGKYGAALAQLTVAAKKAFNNNENITTEFVEQHLNQFSRMANGDESALKEIRKALEVSAKETLQNIDGNSKAAEAFGQIIEGLDETDFSVVGTFDASDIINSLNLTWEQAKAVQEKLNSIGWAANIEEFIGSNNLPAYRLVINNATGDAIKNAASSGGGGGGGKSKDFKNDFDKYYNMVEDINELERLRNLLETDYEQLLKSEAISGKAIYDNLKKQIQLLKERRDITADLAEKRKGQIFETMDDKQYASVRKYAWWNDTDQTIEIDWDAINKVKDSEQGDLIKEYVSKLEGFQSQYDEQIEALEDIETTLQEIQKRGQEEYTSLEDRTRDALIKQIQDKIDELTAVDEAINDTNQKLMDSIQKELEKQRQERENAKTEEELADKEQRLAYLQQDSSGANALEIAKLQEELADARENYTDSLIDQKISELQEQNDEAAQQRQEQIDLMQQSLDWQEKSGAFWEQVYEYIQAGTDEVGTLVHGSELENLLKAGEAWDSLSEEGQMKWLEELENQVAQAIGYLSLSRQLEEIGTKEGTKITFTDAEGNTHTGTVDKNGNVVVKNADGSTTTWKDVYQSYDGSYQTLETQENAQTTPKPATNSGKPSSGGNNGGNEPRNTPPPPSKDWDVDTSGDTAVAIKKVGKGKYSTEKEAKEAAAKLNIFDVIFNTKTKKWFWQELPFGNGKYRTLAAAKKNAARFNADGIMPYKTGGLADYTGPAWLDGTPSKPELVLNARDTENFIQLKDHLAALRQVGTFNTGGDNYYDIDVHVDSLGSDYDVDMAIDRIKTRLYQDGAYRNVNTLNRLR